MADAPQLISHLRAVLPYALEEAHSLEYLPDTCKFNIVFTADTISFYVEIYDTATGTHAKLYLCDATETQYNKISVRMLNLLNTEIPKIEPYRAIRQKFAEFDEKTKSGCSRDFFDITTNLKVMVRKNEDIYSRQKR